MSVFIALGGRALRQAGVQHTASSGAGGHLTSAFPALREKRLARHGKCQQGARGLWELGRDAQCFGEDLPPCGGEGMRTG